MTMPLREAVAIGTVVEFTRTISEADVYLFAGITGDDGRNHTDEEYMKTTRYGRRLVQGAYLIGLMSGASVRWAERLDMPGASYGFDRIRFTKPVFLGDTIRVRYEVAEVDDGKALIRSHVTCLNQHGDLVALGDHLLKVFPEEKTR